MNLVLATDARQTKPVLFVCRLDCNLSLLSLLANRPNRAEDSSVESILNLLFTSADLDTASMLVALAAFFCVQREPEFLKN